MGVMNQATLLDRLGQSKDLHVIAENVRAMCEEYAPVTSFECFRLRQGDDDPVVLCVVGVDSDREQLALIRECGALPFGTGVCLKIPVPETRH